MDNEIFENVQDIKTNEYYEKPKSRNNSRRNNPSRCKNPKEHFPGRIIIAITIYSSDHSIELHSKKCKGFYIFTELQEKINHLDVIKIFAKNENEF